MAKLPIPKFNLRLPKAEKETLISLYFRYRGKRLVYSTGYSIHPKDWDSKTQRPIPQERRPDLFAIKRALDDLTALCTSIYIESDYGAICFEEFKQRLDIKTGKEVTPEPSEADLENNNPNFFEFIEQELADMQAAKMKRGSFKIFKRHAAILKEFAEAISKNGKLFTYEDVDWDLRLKLVDWLTARNVQLAYGNKTLKILRQFLEKAKRKKLHSNSDYYGSGWVVSCKKAKGQTVTFNIDELNQLAEMRLSGHLEKIRDICLIGAGTGQRFSDFAQYSPENFYQTMSGIPILSLISTKTDTPTKVPLNIFPWLIPILEKHDYSTPKMSMQKFNNGIKELIKLAGFDDQVLIVEQYMGRKARIEKYYQQKYEAVSSHICRRSFATNLYRMGYRLSQIMPMTGHSTESQLRQYIGIDNEQNAEEIGLMILQQNGQAKIKPNRLQAV